MFSRRRSQSHKSVSSTSKYKETQYQIIAALLTDAQDKKQQAIEMIRKIPDCKGTTIGCNPIRKKKRLLKKWFEDEVSAKIAYYGQNKNKEGIENMIEICEIYIDNLTNYTKENGLYAFEHNINHSKFSIGVDYLSNIFHFYNGGVKSRKQRKTNKNKSTKKGYKQESREYYGLGVQPRL
jgi:hypothetical protein